MKKSIIIIFLLPLAVTAQFKSDKYAADYACDTIRMEYYILDSKSDTVLKCTLYTNGTWRKSIDKKIFNVKPSIDAGDYTYVLYPNFTWEKIKKKIIL